MRSALLLVLVQGVLMAAGPILVHGHRGARALRPENTLPAFEYAIAAGVDFLEMDVAVTRDEVLVISHDPRLNPAICQGPGGSNVIHELTLAELRRWDCGSLRNPHFPRQEPVPGTGVPTLDEVLDLAPRGSFQFNIETKIFPNHPELTPSPDRFAALLLDVVRRHGLESRVVVQSFDYRTLVAMRKLAPRIRLSALCSGTVQDPAVIARAAGGAQILSPEHSTVTPETVRSAHASGLQVVPWTANTPADWERMIAAGADAIITDDPAGLIAYLKQKNLR